MMLGLNNMSQHRRIIHSLNIIFFLFLWGSSSLAFALSYGVYEVLPYNKTFKDKAFHMCVQQGGAWYRTGAEKTWKGKWIVSLSGMSKKNAAMIEKYSVFKAEKAYIFQAIAAQGGQMKSIAVEETAYGIGGLLIEVNKLSGEGTSFEIELKYKGADCASFQSDVTQDSATHVTPPKDVYEVREKQPLGPWQVSAVYKNGVFERCAATIHGTEGELRLSLNPKQDYYILHLPAITGLKRGSRVQAHVAFDQETSFNQEVVMDLDDGHLMMNVYEGLSSAFFGYAHDAAYGEIRNSRDLHFWVKGEKHTWPLSHTFYVRDVLDICINQEIHPNQVVEMWTDRFPLPQVSGVLKNEFTGKDICLRVMANAKVMLAPCTGGDSTWVPSLSRMNAYQLHPSSSAQDQCLTADQHGQLGVVKCGKADHQDWVFESWKNDPTHVRLKTLGDGDWCLDVMNNVQHNRVQMAPCADLAGQAWHANSPHDMLF